VNLVYTDVAVEDLKRLKAFIADHPAELVGKIELLLEFPRLGTPVEMAPTPESLRDMIFGKYVIPTWDITFNIDDKLQPTMPLLSSEESHGCH